MRYLAFVSVVVLLVSGCVEPYPGWSISDISGEDVPRAVVRAFREDFPNARITKVERSTFESRMSGHPRKYRISFERSGSESQRVIYDSAGKRADGFDFWFERMPANQRAAANGRPAGQSGGSDNLSATIAADRAFPAAVAELGHSA